jgi:hypothetical protein
MKRKSFPHVFFAVATIATSIFSFSVPSQASEYGYLYELETMAKKQGVKHYLDDVSISEQLKRGNKYCKIMEYASIKDIHSLFEELGQEASKKGYSERQVYDLALLEASALHASVQELCPEYEYKINNLLEYLEEEES